MAKKKSVTKVDFALLKKAINEELTEEKCNLALSLVNKAEFMENVLVALETKVNEDGVVTEMCQGEYSIDRENPALRSYNTTIKNYTSVIKQIYDMLPNKNAIKDDGFDDF